MPDAHPPVNVIPRRRKVDVGMRLLIGFGVCMALCVLVGGAIIIPHLVRAVREFDGNRPLINGYNLWMLHGYPREIMHGDSASIGDCTVPSTWPIGTQEVGKYAIVGNTIAGEIDRFSHSPTQEAPPNWIAPAALPTHFILDTQAGILVEFASRAQWVDALAARGINAGTLKLVY